MLDAITRLRRVQPRRRVSGRIGPVPYQFVCHRSPMASIQSPCQARVKHRP